MLSHLERAKFRGQRVGVALGGESQEREISLKTGQAFGDALRALGYDTVIYDVTTDLHQIARDRPAAVLLATHGGIGESGVLQGYLEALGIPYTGSGVLASALAMDKARAKAIFRSENISVAESAVLRDWSPEREAELVDVLAANGLELPLVAKLNNSGSSFGVHICRTIEQLKDALRQLFGNSSDSHSHVRSPSDGVLIESLLEGPEYSVGFFDQVCLGGIEVRAEGGFYDFNAKYQSGKTQYTVVNDPALRFELERLAKAAYNSLGCRGVARVDVMSKKFSDTPSLCVLEVNTVPGMTATSLVPMLAKQHGIDFAEFVEYMLCSATCECELER